MGDKSTFMAKSKILVLFSFFFLLKQYICFQQDAPCKLASYNFSFQNKTVLNASQDDAVTML